MLERDVPAPHRRLMIDLTDFDAVLDACDGIDTIVHLGADPSPEADFDGSLLDNNIRATYNVFEAAARSGCERVIVASSIARRSRLSA